MVCRGQGQWVFGLGHGLGHRLEVMEVEWWLWKSWDVDGEVMGRFAMGGKS